MTEGHGPYWLNHFDLQGLAHCSSIRWTFIPNNPTINKKPSFEQNLIRRLPQVVNIPAEVWILPTVDRNTEWSAG